MPGLLSDDGYIYQRKVIIHVILEHLLNSELAECHIELECVLVSDTDTTYSLDFHIKTNGNKQKYYEVKNKQKLYQKGLLRPVINNFNHTFQSLTGAETEFHLIHSSQLRGDYLPELHMPTKKEEALIKIDPSYSHDFCERFFARQITDDIDLNLDCSDLELRSISIINKILKQFNIHQYGAAEAVYNAIRTCFENIESQEAQRLKQRISSQLGLSFPVRNAVAIPLFDLLDFGGSLFDKISSKRTFQNRTEAINAFYAQFSVPAISVRPNQI